MTTAVVAVGGTRPKECDGLAQAMVFSIIFRLQYFPGSGRARNREAGVCGPVWTATRYAWVAQRLGLTENHEHGTYSALLNRAGRSTHCRPGPVCGCGPLAFQGRCSDRQALVRAVDEQKEARPLGAREERQRHESVEHTE